MKKKICICILSAFFLTLIFSSCYAIEDIKIEDIKFDEEFNSISNRNDSDNNNLNIYGDKITNKDSGNYNKEIIEAGKEAFKIDEYVDKLNEYNKDNIFELKDITSDLIGGKGISYNSIFKKILSFVGEEILVSARGFVAILVALILMSVIKNIQVDSEGSSIYKITYFATYVLIATMVITTFMSSLEMFQKTITSLLSVVQVATPFLMTLLVATGSITTTGIISPIILFIVQFIGFVINFVVVPFVILSLVFNIVSNISDKIKLTRVSELFNKSAIWIIGTSLTLFLCVISLEGSLSSSIDGVAMKTVQAGVTNIVPVVGKFFSDSLDAVVGARKHYEKCCRSSFNNCSSWNNDFSNIKVICNNGYV